MLHLESPDALWRGSHTDQRGSLRGHHSNAPQGVAARVHLKGWASAFVFDDQRFSNLGNDVRLQSPDYEATTPGYDIEVASSASTISITSE